MDKKNTIVTVAAFSANRIMVFGKQMANAVVPKSATAFNFQKAYRLSDAKVRLTFWT